MLTKKQMILIKENYKSVTIDGFSLLFRLKNYSFDKEKVLDYINKCNKEETQKEKIVQKLKEESKLNKINFRAKTLLNGVKSRVKEKNIDFDLDLEWIEERMIKGVCEATGIKFKIKQYKEGEETLLPHAFAPSIDRIDPNKGYTKDNCQLVCDHFNRMKSNKSMKQTYMLALHFVKHQRQIKKNRMDQLIQS